MSKNQKKAAEIAAQHKVKEVFENSRGEFFTSHNLAVNSEAGKAENVYTHTFTGKENVPADDDVLIDKISKAKTSEAVDKLVTGSTSAAVIKAGEDRKTELAKPKE